MRGVRNIFYGIAGMIIGVVLFGGGINMFLHPAEVTCGGKVMEQGDICNQYRNGIKTGSRDYDQQKQDNQSTKYFLVIGGPLLSIGCFFLLRSGLRRRRAIVSPAVNVNVNQPYQPGAYPQPGYPQQPTAYGAPGYPQQPGAYPAQPGYPQQQSGAYPPPGYPQQPGAYPPGAYPPQQPGGYPPPPGYQQ